MSLPHRQIPAFPRVWVRGHASGVLVLFWTMVFWGSTQAVLWFAGVSEPLDLVSLSGAAIYSGEYWRLFTYQFIHSGGIHFAINLLVIWLAGREIEPIVGRHHFLTLCLVANLMGGLASLAVSSHGAVVGFSAAAAAVIVAYATIMPELEQSVTLLFIFPLKLRAKYFASAILLFGVVCLGTGTMNEIGPAGILAGGVLGWLWARKLGFGNPMWFQRRSFERMQRERRIERMSAEDFISTEIDPILEKISRHGIRSLTRAERKVLDEGRKKIAAPTVGRN